MERACWCSVSYVKLLGTKDKDDIFELDSSAKKYS